MSYRVPATLFAIFLLIFPLVSPAIAQTKILPEGTRVYLKLDQLVSGKRGEAEAGDIVACSVWRDVDLQGVVMVKAGTKALCKVESVKHANIAGIKGKLVLAAMDTAAIDGQKLQLTGGYNKEGKSRMAMTISLAALVAWPLIFITGKAAELTEGTVIDAYTGPDLPVVIPASAVTPQAISLTGLPTVLSAEVVLDEFLAPNAKPEEFKIKVIRPGIQPVDLVIDNVNGKPVQPMPLAVRESKVVDGDTQAVATISIKTLSKTFQKGINRFEVAYTVNGQRESTEVILNIQM